jgi:hypothetical protein
MSGQFDFADYRDTQLAGVHEWRDIVRNAGADDDQVLLAEGSLAVLSGFNGDTLVEQRRNLRPELLLRFLVGDGDARASRLEK